MKKHQPPWGLERLCCVGAVVVFGLAVRHFPKGALVKESDFDVVGNSVASFSRDLIRTCFCMFDTDPTYPISPNASCSHLQSAFQDTNKTCLDSECINLPTFLQSPTSGWPCKALSSSATTNVRTANLRSFVQREAAKHLSEAKSQPGHSSISCILPLNLGGKRQTNKQTNKQTTKQTNQVSNRSQDTPTQNIQKSVPVETN